MDKQNGVHLGDRVEVIENGVKKIKLVWDTCCVNGCNKRAQRECEFCVPKEQVIAVNEDETPVTMKIPNRMCLDHWALHVVSKSAYKVVCPKCKKNLKQNEAN